jgi:hypothetical protein
MASTVLALDPVRNNNDREFPPVFVTGRLAGTAFFPSWNPGASCAFAARAARCNIPDRTLIERATGDRLPAARSALLDSYVLKGVAGEDLHMGDHPIAWIKCIGNGRSFYSAIGHRPESYSEPHNVKLLERAISWAAGAGETRCRNGKETAPTPG